VGWELEKITVVTIKMKKIIIITIIIINMEAEGV